MARKEKKLRGTFRSISGKDPAEGFYYEVIKGEAIPSDPSNGLHKRLSLFGYALRTDYGVRRVWPSDGEIFVWNLPLIYPGPPLWVDLEEIPV